MIEIPELSETSARALLQYLYTWEMTKITECSATAVEVFQVAHVYGLGLLEGILKDVFKSCSSEWFGVDAALQLFCYIRKVECCHDLKFVVANTLKM